MPHPDDKKVAATHTRILEDGESMRIRSDVGTDLTVAIVDSAPGFQCGFTDEPRALGPLAQQDGDVLAAT